jgi:hypothetical protein
MVKMVAAGAMTVAGLAVGAPAAGATSTSGTAVATASSAAELQAQYAGQYDLYNLTDQVLTVDSAWVTGTTWDGIAPAAGKKIYPGQKLHFGVNAKGTSGTDAGWVYLRVGQSRSYVVAVAKPSFSVGLRDSRVDYEPLRESGMDFGDGAFTVTPGGSNRSNLTVTNTKVRTHTLSADNAAAQLETLREICANDSSAQCAFTPTAYTDVLTAPKLTGGVLKNNGATTVDRQHSWKSVTTTTSQWGVQAGLSANVLNMVTTTFSSTYTKTVTDTSEVGSTTTVPVLPGWASWVTYEAPVFRTTGDFVVKVGGNTWKLTGVTFDVPKPDADLNGTLNVEQLPLGDPRIPNTVPVVQVAS